MQKDVERDIYFYWRKVNINKYDTFIELLKYLTFLEAFGTTWSKNFCSYDKDTKVFTMLPYNQLTTKSVSNHGKISWFIIVFFSIN